jgi:hypothetical protein
MGGDALAELASTLDRPPASLVAFAQLSDDQLRMLAAAIDSAAERRRRLIDRQLHQALPAPVVWLLRGSRRRDR